MTSAAFNKTVSSIFDAVLDERHTLTALEAVANFVGAAGAGILLVNKFTGQISSSAGWGIFAGNRADFLAHYGKIDPFRTIREKAGCGSLARLSEILPQSLLRRDEWYSDFLLKGGVCDLLDAKLHQTPSHTLLFGLHRAIGDAGPFPRDAERFQALMPSLCNAARLHVGLLEIGYRSPIGQGRIDQLAAGAIFTDEHGRIIETNPAGECVLRAGDGLTMRDGKISARRSFETAKLARLIADAAAAGTRVPYAGCMLIARDDGHPPYVVRVAPAGGGLAGDDLPMAMLVISTPGESRVSQGELAELYGLSPVESRIALALARGKRLTELAREFGVQVSTLRSQLSSILTKCGVGGQSDLVRLISTIPVIHPTPPETTPE